MWPRKGTPIDWTVLFSPTEAAMKERTKLCTGKLQTWATTWAFAVKKALRSLSLSFFLKISPLHPFSLTSLILTARSSHQQRLSLSLSLSLAHSPPTNHPFLSLKHERFLLSLSLSHERSLVSFPVNGSRSRSRRSRGAAAERLFARFVCEDLLHWN